MVFTNIAIEIAVFSVVIVIVSRWLQVRFGNKKAVNAMQKRIKEKQKLLKELLKQDDPKSKKEAEEIQSGMMGDLNKMMSSNMRVMVISMIIYIPALAALGFFYNGLIVNSPIPLVVFHRGGDFFFWFEIASKSNWFSWYFWWTLITSLVLQVVFKKMKIE